LIVFGPIIYLSTFNYVSGPLSRPFSGVTAASLPIDIDRGCAIWNVDLEDYRIRETTREGVMEGQQPPIEEEDGGIRDRSNNKANRIIVV
jgi:hypothetical protein